LTGGALPGFMGGDTPGFLGDNKRSVPG
jgi:hypothetical protein